VWRPDADAQARGRVVTNLKEDRATQMQGSSRDEAVKDFLSGKGWYHAADVDRLSEEEADIIAARLIRFIKSKSALPNNKAEPLQHAFSDLLRKDLTGKGTGGAKLQDVARDYLDPEQLKILKEAIKDEEAIETGEKPVPKEQ